MKFKDLIKPTKNKMIFSLALLLPSFAFAFIISLLTQNIILFIILGIVIGYMSGCALDYFVKNNTVKIVIASVSGLISIILAYLIYKAFSEPMVCDPVHVPSDCEIVCREILDNASNITAEISQKFEECMDACYR